MKTLAKRKLSAYNRHVAREMKAGKTMKQAAKSWKKPKTTTKRRVSSKRKASSRKQKTVAKKFTLGGYSPMGILKAAALYVGTNIAISRVAPQVSRISGGTEIATGVIAMSTGLTGNAFLALGAAKAVAGLLGGVLNGRVSNGSGGYDY